MTFFQTTSSLLGIFGFYLRSQDEHFGAPVYLVLAWMVSCPSRISSSLRLHLDIFDIAPLYHDIIASPRTCRHCSASSDILSSLVSRRTGPPLLAHYPLRHARHPIPPPLSLAIFISFLLITLARYDTNTRPISRFSSHVNSHLIRY